jgi:hypothetical protein
MADEGQAELAVADQLGFVHGARPWGYGRVADQLRERASASPQRTVLEGILNHQIKDCESS